VAWHGEARMQTVRRAQLRRAGAERDERESLGEFGRGEGELGLAFIGEEGKGRGLWGGEGMPGGHQQS
jgi:hypothetical protein